MTKLMFAVSDSTVKTAKLANEMISAAYPIQKIAAAKDKAETKAKNFISDVQDGVGAATYSHIGETHEASISLNDDFVNDGIMLMAKVLIAISVPLMALLAALMGMAGLFEKISEKFDEIGGDFKSKWFPGENESESNNEVNAHDKTEKKPEYKYGILLVKARKPARHCKDGSATDWVISARLVERTDNDPYATGEKKNNYVESEADCYYDTLDEMETAALSNGEIDWISNSKLTAKKAMYDAYNRLLKEAEEEDAKATESDNQKIDSQDDEKPYQVVDIQKSTGKTKKDKPAK